MERIEIIGYIGADVRPVTYQNETFYTINVGVSRKINGVESTFWYTCNFNQLSDKLKQYLVKGQCVFVCGQPRYRIFDSAKYRMKVIGVELFVERIELVGKAPEKPASEQQTGHAGQQAQQPQADEEKMQTETGEQMPF